MTCQVHRRYYLIILLGNGGRWERQEALCLNTPAHIYICECSPRCHSCCSLPQIAANSCYLQQCSDVDTDVATITALIFQRMMSCKICPRVRSRYYGLQSANACSLAIALLRCNQRSHSGMSKYNVITSGVIAIATKGFAVQKKRPQMFCHDIATVTTKSIVVSRSYCTSLCWSA